MTRPLTSTVASALVLALAHTAFAAVDTDTFTAEGELHLNEPVALVPLPEQSDTFTTTDFPDADQLQLTSPSATNGIDYSFIDQPGGASFAISGSAHADESPNSSSTATLDATFVTTKPLIYSFDPAIATIPNFFEASFNDIVANVYPDMDAFNGIGGNLLDETWPNTGVLQPGEHTLSFELVGGGHRGDPTWGADASVNLNLTSIPEPTTAALLSLTALAALRRRNTPAVPARR